MNLQMFLGDLLKSGILGGLAYPAMEFWDIGVGWRPLYRRALSWAISIGLGVLPYLAAVGMQYEPVPADWRGWIEACWSVAFVAVTASQGLHAALKLKK